ncbi:hypothetical protein LguiA_004641 [Lonicera macranthoides]
MFTQFIKPASATPSHLKRYNLSSIDQFTPRVYIPIVFYYPNCVSNGLQDNADKSSRLKCSLSEILIHYYPFAGRLNSTAYVDCNDEGVEFQEVNMKCGLSEILEKPADEAMGLVFPAGLVWGDLNSDSSLLVIRLSHFECGGISIAVCLSHKLGDVQTFLTFMNYWAVKMRANTSCDDALLSPHFISHPSTNDAIIVPERSLMKKQWVTRRFIFPNSKIAELKTMGKESGSKNITRVEVLSALLWKCAMAATAANSRFFSPTVLLLSVNMRNKMLPPLPKTSVGNLYPILTIATKNESENNINVLVEKIKKGKMEIGSVKILDLNVYLSVLQEFAQNNYNFFYFSNLCKMEFYQGDFGWGNPSRVTLADAPGKNNFFLMDTPNGDGIAAVVSLEEQNMISFEQDKEILAFTSSP